jgi:hypothetical protein
MLRDTTAYRAISYKRTLYQVSLLGYPPSSSSFSLSITYTYYRGITPPHRMPSPQGRATKMSGSAREQIASECSYSPKTGQLGTGAFLGAFCPLDSNWPSYTAALKKAGWGGRNSSLMISFLGLPLQRAKLGQFWGPFRGNAPSVGLWEGHYGREKVGHWGGCLGVVLGRVASPGIGTSNDQTD